MQAGLGIRILPRKPQTKRDVRPVIVRILIDGGLAKRIVAGTPHHYASTVGQLVWRRQVVGVDVVDRCIVNNGQRRAVEVDVFFGRRAALGQQFAIEAVGKA